MEVTTFDAGEIFAGRKSGVQVQGFTTPCPQTPVIDKGYAWDAWHRDVIVWACHLAGTPLFISGPLGCGKSSCLRQVAARLNWPVYEITGHEALQSVDLQGHMALRDGNTVWVDGPLVQAMRHGGLCLFNEMDAALPSATIALNTVLDGAPLCIEQTGEIVRPHPLFRFAATGNTCGNGDDSGAYVGTVHQNAALLDRFMAIEASYLPEDVEGKLLGTALPEVVRNTMQAFAKVVRQAVAGQSSDYQDLTVPVSTRALVLWAALAQRFAGLAKAGVNVLEYSMLRAVGNKRSHAERVVLCEILQRVTN